MGQAGHAWLWWSLAKYYASHCGSVLSACTATAQDPTRPGDGATGVRRDFQVNFTGNERMRMRMLDDRTRLDEMDAAGIDVSILSLNPPGVQIFSDAPGASALAARFNDVLIDMIAVHPTRFAGLAAVAPQDPVGAADEIRRTMGLGLGGVMIGSHTHGRYLDEPEFEPILTALEDTDATLYLHPRCPSPDMIGPFLNYGMLAALWGFQADAGTHAARLILSGALDRHPELKIVLGHLGEGLPFWSWRLDNIHRQTLKWAGDQLHMPKLKLTPTEYLHRNFTLTTSGMFDAEVFAFAQQKVGAERLMFAIDYPYEDSLVASRFLSELHLTDADRGLVSHSNAERLFRITPLTQS